jgi:hypothetical protein
MIACRQQRANPVLLPVLPRALERYLTEPATRSELAHRLIPRTELSA